MAKARAKGQQHNQRARWGQVDQGRRPATAAFVDDEIDEIRRVCAKLGRIVRLLIRAWKMQTYFGALPFLSSS
jgi:hypothetical protein